MTQEGYTFVFGGNGTTAYNHPGAPLIADPLYHDNYQFDIPYLDPTTGLVGTKSLPGIGILSTYAQGGNIGGAIGNLLQTLELIWSTVVTDPNWIGAINPIAVKTEFLVPGKNIITGFTDPIAWCDLHLQNVDGHVDYWWGTTDFAKFGFAQWVSGFNHENTQWINNIDTRLRNPNGAVFAPFNALEVTLVDGFYGAANFYSRMQIPHMTYSGPSSGSWPPADRLYYAPAG